MKKLLFLIAPVLLLAGCYQQNSTADLQKPLQQLTQATQQLNQKVDALDAKVTALENSNKTTDTEVPADWKTYTNGEYGFSIKYPADWTVGPQGTDFTGTLPSVPFYSPDLRGDARFAILMRDENEVTMDVLIEEVGEQWGANRREVRESLVINGVNATEITVTDSTNEFPGWYGEDVFLQHNGTIFQISNGAIDSDTFKPFYNSIVFTN
ncbi:MAG: hypothetical protein A3B31_00835 [Candidatus Komeilibacteria bacterium RIFCSPLOWO2_01_FULL_53_11]|uniref:Uncharacterized protein n=1 Tax=Candidatus Komeilibacteria bacterium RIFCSPLOWO2_01_FULL_53_11 TaxID=1798552 RepID=A0A1G2BR10_9BACT|nr:MAG: hypothetical protein A3B31_00835 [Candidatus Komeilibacteria bacterium RIFCSPLOWO2_01_FULL_53_11]